MDFIFVCVLSGVAYETTTPAYYAKTTTAPSYYFTSQYSTRPCLMCVRKSGIFNETSLDVQLQFWSCRWPLCTRSVCPSACLSYGYKHAGCMAKLLRYDTRCYFNVRSKADTSRLNLPHGSLIYHLGYRHAGCLQLSHRRPPETCGLRTRPRTDVDPPRFLDPWRPDWRQRDMPPSNCHRRGAYRLAAPGAITCWSRASASRCWLAAALQFANFAVQFSSSAVNTALQSLFVIKETMHVWPVLLPR